MRVFAIAILALVWADAARAQAPLHQALDAYALFQGDVTIMLDAEINDAAALDAALERTARHDPAHVARGWLAYGAMSAAQSPAWVNGVRSRVRAAGRAPVIRQLRRDMGYARRRPPGSAEATQLVLRALAADSARMIALAVRLEGLGHAADTSAWGQRADDREQALRAPSSRTLAPELAARLHIAPLMAAPLTESGAFGGARFWDALANRASPAPPDLPWALIPARAGVLDRMFTLGGLMIVDAAQSQPTRVNEALDFEPLRQCLAIEQLQLRQCASVTNDANEDAFCLARHGFRGPSACFALAQAP